VTGRLKELYKLENGRYVAPAALEEQLALSPYVEQAFVYGANRPHNVALVVPRAEALAPWARERGLPVEPLGELLRQGAVRRLFRDEIARWSAEFKRFERIEGFDLLEEPFTTDNGLLTPTLKVKRAKVEDRYAGRIAELYADAVRVREAPGSAAQALRAGTANPPGT
jgi:long-chain acyl-CoA synthetase